MPRDVLDILLVDLLGELDVKAVHCEMSLLN
jgi:hypothetical protein